MFLKRDASVFAALVLQTGQNVATLADMNLDFEKLKVSATKIYYSSCSSGETCHLCSVENKKINLSHFLVMDKLLQSTISLRLL